MLLSRHALLLVLLIRCAVFCTGAPGDRVCIGGSDGRRTSRTRVPCTRPAYHACPTGYGHRARRNGDSDEGNSVFRSDVDKDQSSAKLGSFMLTD